MWLLVTALVFAPSPAADPPVVAGKPAVTNGNARDGIVYRPSVDVPITIAALAGAGLFNAASIAHCRWCDLGPDGLTQLNGLDRWAGGARWVNRSSAAGASSKALAAGVVASFGLLTLSTGAANRDKLADLGMCIESIAVTEALTGFSKVLTRRARPYTHDAGFVGPGSKDGNRSFFSGHASMAFATVASAASVAGFRPESAGRRKAILAIGLPLAAATSYLRIAAGQHYLTDVLAGAAVGSAVGVLVPRLHLRHQRVSLTLRPAVGAGGSIVASW